MRRIVKENLPKDLERDIISAYRTYIEKRYGKNADVAVRSSATAEDLPGASFAGEQESYLGIRGTKELLVAVRATMASLVHRSRHFVSRRSRFRSFEDRAFGRRAEDGAFRQGVFRRDVHARHGIRFPECRIDQRFVGSSAR